jgi:hypothetical protein
MNAYEGAAEIQVNGRTLAEATKVTIRVMANDTEVNTLVQGFAGFSDGPGKCEISIESAVPKKGYEFDFVEAVRSKATVTIVSKSAGRRHRSEGRIKDAEWSNQTDAPTLLSANFTGKMLKSLGG